jgi:hypothetical protein
VISWQPSAQRPAGQRRDRWQREHRVPVGVPPVGGSAAQGAVLTHVRATGDPVGALAVEVRRPGEDPTWQEAGLQVAVAPLDHTLGLRVRRPALDRTDSQSADERGELGGQLRAGRVPGPDRGLVVPDQHPRERPEALQQKPMPSEQIRALPGGDHHGRQPTWVTRDHDQHRGRPTWPAPSGMSAGGNHRSHCASSPGRYEVRETGPAGRNTPHDRRGGPISTSITGSWSGFRRDMITMRGKSTKHRSYTEGVH